MISKIQVQVCGTDIDVTGEHDAAWAQVATAMRRRYVGHTPGTEIGANLRIVTITTGNGLGRVLGKAIVDYNA